MKNNVAYCLPLFYYVLVRSLLEYNWFHFIITSYLYFSMLINCSFESKKERRRKARQGAWVYCSEKSKGV